MAYFVEYEKGISDYFFCDFGKEAGQNSHIHSHVEVVFVFDGNIQANISGLDYTFTSGEMFLIMPYEIHSYGGDATTFVISCPTDYFQEQNQFLVGKVFSPLFTTFGNIEKEMILDIVNEKYRCDLKKKALMYYVFSRFKERSNLLDRNLSEHDTYRRAIIYITQNFKEHVSLKKTAFAVGVSEEHLSRIFNASGRAGFSEVINALRVHSARSRLINKNLSISDIALEAGFGSIRNFNRIFKQHFHCTPSEFRKKYQ